MKKQTAPNPLSVVARPSNEKISKIVKINSARVVPMRVNMRGASNIPNATTKDDPAIIQPMFSAPKKRERNEERTKIMRM